MSKKIQFRPIYFGDIEAGDNIGFFGSNNKIDFEFICHAQKVGLGFMPVGKIDMNRYRYIGLGYTRERPAHECQPSAVEVKEIAFYIP